MPCRYNRVPEWAAWVWLNGRLVRGAEAVVSLFDRSFLMGDGLFETLRSVQGRLFRLDRHLARLEQGAALLRLSLPWNVKELTEAIHRTIAANSLSGAAVRLTVSRGVGPPGPGLGGAKAPLCVIAARPFAGYPEHWYDPGATAIVSSIVKNDRSPLSGVKSTSYLEHVLARAESTDRGADEALLLNTRGQFAEGSSTNLFAVIDGRLVTPDVASGCLPGVTRESVLEIARLTGMEVQEEPMSGSAWEMWDEAFLTNSLLAVAPLVRIDDRPVRGGLPGPMTLRLAQMYLDLVTRETSESPEV